MADFTITVSNTINTFGPWPNKWGIMQWGVDKWGEGTQDLFVEDVNLISNTATISDDWFLNFTLVVSNSLSLSPEITDGILQDGEGYYYVFPKPVTDGDDQIVTTYTEVSDI